MDTSKYIALETFCRQHQLSWGFIELLESRGLLQLVVYDQSRYLPLDVLDRIEKLVRLLRELDIHPDDLDVIEQLLLRIASLQAEIHNLREQVRFYRHLYGEEG